ncbi:hypothetical protein V502_06954 [Pseudogymnoascus sp. VKM F-4520 (FW-2644)]|nr:hypothetical protein V502_06954 [Pseudogymnoascus sp. VKM F-4520 (FW-2644)]
MSVGDPLPISVVLGSAAAVGTPLHQFFRTVEADRYPLSILGSVIASHWAVAYGLQSTREQYASFWASHGLAFLIVSTAVVSLWANIIIYRAFFHPLNKFPGPFGAKLTKLWSLKQVVGSDIRWYRVVSELHKQHGDYVRIGPRELSVLDTAALIPMLGVRMEKGPFYGAMERSVHTNRDATFHKKRRKVWDMAFKQTLADYGPTIEDFTDSLLARIDTLVGKTTVVNDLCIHYSYDVMSSLAFGSSTGFIEGTSSDVATTILNNIKEGIVAVGLFLHVPWMLTIVETLSFVGPMKLFKSWSSEKVAERRKMTNSRPDIMGYLLEHTEDSRENRALLDAESRVIIGAGSDTTASALATMFTILANDPSCQEKLRQEVNESFKDGSYTCARPQNLLDGVISETLRICPPVLFAPQRMVPEGGIRIGDVQIPGGTILSFSTYNFHHDKRNFVQPENFIPERWTTRPELIIHKNACIPFVMGPYKCPGKAIAMMELRSVIAKTVCRYDISFPKGAKFDLNEFFLGVKDHFTAGIPEQELVFTRRKE